MNTFIFTATFILLSTVVNQGVVKFLSLVSRSCHCLSLTCFFVESVFIFFYFFLLLRHKHLQNNIIILGISNPAIGFSAILSQNTYLENDHAIVYDNVVTNVRNGYNRWSGHFAAPRKGLYVFTCSVRANSKVGITVVIVHNGRPVLRIASSVYSPETGSGSVTLILKKGDNVWVKRLGHGRHIEKHYNYFSGYLISAEI